LQLAQKEEAPLSQKKPHPGKASASVLTFYLTPVTRFAFRFGAGYIPRVKINAEG
jgi:hypothetical protein